MKQFLIILSLLVSFVFYSFKEKGKVSNRHYNTDTFPVVNRSNNSLYVKDGRVYGGLNFNPPTYDDTTAANAGTNIGNDYNGAIIYTKNTHWYWGRYNHKWYPFANTANQLFPTCGNPNGTHIVTHDSLLVYDVTAGPYVICCDGVPRFTNFTVVSLDSNNSDFQRIDWIVLDTTGVKVVKGTPGLNPNPQLLDSCEIPLTFVLINAHSNVPASVTQNNPLLIYDEFNPNEWDSLRYSGMQTDSANTQFPIHLTRALHVWNYSTDGNNFFEFHTDSTINLNDYGAFKFYIRDSSAVRVAITWYLDDVPQTNTILAPVSTSILNSYQNIVMSPPSWIFIGTSTQVNTVRFTIIPVTPSDAKGLFFDWIQLQNGIPSPTPIIPPPNFSSGNLTPLFNDQVTISGNNIFLSHVQQAAPPYTVLGNETNASGPYSFGKVDVAHSIVGQVPNPNIAPGPNGSFKFSTGGAVTDLIPQSDTIYARNWLRLTPDGNGNDTLDFGSKFPDSSLLRFDTFLGLNGKLFDILNAGDEWFTINSHVGQASIFMGPTGAGGTSVFFLQSQTGNYTFQLGATDSLSNNVGIIGNATSQTISINGQLVLNPQFTPANANDNTYPFGTLTADNTFLWYRTSTGTWKKIAWTAF